MVTLCCSGGPGTDINPKGFQFLSKFLLYSSQLVLQYENYIEIYFLVVNLYAIVYTGYINYNYN